MKKSIVFTALIALVLTGCGKDVVEDASEQASSVLKVRTRAGSDDVTVSYPVNVYVFQGDECKSVQTINDAETTLSLTLPEGTYTICAIGGSSSNAYTMPAAEDASTTTPITLKDGAELTDLMAAKTTVTLTDGETNTLTLGMERKVMSIESITISQVPTAATAVSVSFSPLWQSLTVGTNYSGTDGTATIALAQPANGNGRTWTSTDAQFLLPPSEQPAAIKVRITTAEGTKSYTYSSSEELEAGYKINIVGTYTESVGVELTGTITGTAWKGERTITFDFDETSSTGSSTTNPTNPTNNTITGDIPAVNTLYHGCFVLSVTDQGDHAEVVLVSPKEEAIGMGRFGFQTEAELDAAIEAVIIRNSVDDFSDWRLPTVEELNSLNSVYTTANSLFSTNSGNTIDNTKRYLCIYGNDVKSHQMSSLNSNVADFATNDLIRPFVSITIAKE